MAERVLEPLDLKKSIEHGVFVDDVVGFIPNFNVNLDWLEGMRSDTQEFQPYRLVLDLEMVPANPELEINFRVYFTHEDLKQIRKIKLLKWDGSSWLKISDQPTKLADNQLWAGYFEIVDYKIGDPPISLGE